MCPFFPFPVKVSVSSEAIGLLIPSIVIHITPNGIFLFLKKFYVTVM
jgi:hypothetical protein